MRWLYRAQKAGHTGALDPLANRHYFVITVRLGQTTTTGDVEGDILQERPIPVLSKELIEQTLEKFRGDIQQVPPMYSALKRR